LEHYLTYTSTLSIIKYLIVIVKVEIMKIEHSYLLTIRIFLRKKKYFIYQNLFSLKIGKFNRI